MTKIAIHHRPGSFSEQWIQYCKKNNLEFDVVNCYDDDIVEQLKKFTVLLWHHSHVDYRDILFAKTLLFSLEQSGMIVFPNYRTCWHFDDKVGQKYLFESINARLVPSHVFYEKEKALTWAKTVDYPVVFKLRGGASASNVSLIKNENECRRVISKAFGTGFSQYRPWNTVWERTMKFLRRDGSIKEVLRAMNRLIRPTQFDRMSRKEKGYVYFQDFVPNNNYDMRIIVIGGKYAYGMKRLNRSNDFRASGSSLFVYDNIPLSVIESAFHLSNALMLQAVAFDFILGTKAEPLVIEMSYGFGTKGSSKCPGYWTSDLQWHNEKPDPFGWIIRQVVEDHSGSSNLKPGN